MPAVDCKLAWAFLPGKAKGRGLRIEPVFKSDVDCKIAWEFLPGKLKVRGLGVEPESCYRGLGLSCTSTGLIVFVFLEIAHSYVSCSHPCYRLCYV